MHAGSNRLPSRAHGLTALVAGLLAAVALALPATATASSGDCSLEPTAGTETRQLGDRSYLLHVPAGLSGEAPLLLSLHGFGSNGSQVETSTGWSGFAAQEGFIAAYPQGRGSSLSGAWDPYTSPSVDAAFLRQVSDDIAATYCVDRVRVHVDGWSNGAVMSQRTACEAADHFASVSSYAGGTPTAGGVAAACEPSRPISVALIVGQFDFTVAGLAANTAEWVDLNDCDPQPSEQQDSFGETDTYDCANGTQVLSRIVGATSHNWPDGARGQDQRERIWAFFEAHPRP